MNRILTAIDGSASANKALDFAADLAVKCEADLILLTVAADVAPIFDAQFAAYARSEHFQPRASELALTAAETMLAGARLHAQARGVTRISTEATLGDPAHQIIVVATDRQADLLVMGSRGHGPLAGLLLGSVTQKVISHATCPVVVVR
jgi:nucleotide-binding universal stress UspA family protein